MENEAVYISKILFSEIECLICGGSPCVVFGSPEDPDLYVFLCDNCYGYKSDSNSESEASSSSSADGENDELQCVDIGRKRRKKRGRKNKRCRRLSKRKAKKILQHGSVRGCRLTFAQKRFFGFVAGGGKPTRTKSSIEEQSYR